jgi:general secretion pathway protein F
MPLYEYHGLTAEGRTATGIVDADTPRTARTKLKRQGIFPTDLLEGHDVPVSGQRLSFLPWRAQARPKDIAVLTRQLGTLLAAGLAVVDALTALLEQAPRGALRFLLADLRESIREGRSLSRALERHERIFSPIYIQLVRTGEFGGHLDEVFLRLAELLEAQDTLRDRVRAALAYPVFLFITAGVALAVLMGIMIPRVTAMFSEMHRVLPWSTRMLIASSNIVLTHGIWIAVIGGIALWGLARLLQTPVGHALRDAWFLKLPVVGPLLRQMALARLARTLGTLLGAGVALLPALALARRVMNNTVLERALAWTGEELSQGKSLGATLASTGQVPSLLTHMVAVGEQSGELDAMLLKAAHMYDREAESTLAGLMSLLSPVLVLIMGLIVLFIVTAILVPIFELSEGVR